MSSTKRGGKRCEADYYVTPPWCVQAVLPYLVKDVIECPNQLWLEPCAGNGQIIKAVNSMMGDWQPSWGIVELREEEQKSLVELDLDAQSSIFCPQDFLTWEPDHDYDIGFTNVPFSLSTQFVEKAMTCCEYFITLQRLNWFGSQKRRSFWKEHPANAYILDKRICFTGDGQTDSIEYAWFVFGPECGGKYTLIDCDEWDGVGINDRRKDKSRL